MGGIVLHARLFCLISQLPSEDSTWTVIVYYANELRRQGLSEGDLREASTVRRDIWSYMESGQGYEKTKSELDEARTKPWFGQAKEQQDDSFGPLPTPAELSKPVGHSTLWFKQEAVL